MRNTILSIVLGTGLFIADVIVAQSRVDRGGIIARLDQVTAVYVSTNIARPAVTKNSSHIYPKTWFKKVEDKQLIRNLLAGLKRSEIACEYRPVLFERTAIVLSGSNDVPTVGLAYRIVHGSPRFTLHPVRSDGDAYIFEGSLAPWPSAISDPFREAVVLLDSRTFTHKDDYRTIEEIIDYVTRR